MRRDALLRGLLPALLPIAAVPVVAAMASSSSPSASSAVYAENRYLPQKLSMKPFDYYRHVSVRNLQWTNWGQATASAHGTFTFQFCLHESCSVSPFYDEPVAVWLTRIEHCRARLSYTVLALNVEGPLPDPRFKTYRTSLGACQKQRSGGRRKHA